MVFGELWVQNMAGEMRFIRDERLTAYVAQIGERLARHLPPTGLRFRFYLLEGAGDTREVVASSEVVEYSEP